MRLIVSDEYNIIHCVVVTEKLYTIGPMLRPVGTAVLTLVRMPNVLSHVHGYWTRFRQFLPLVGLVVAEDEAWGV